jgi:hypothetical protein
MSDCERCADLAMQHMAAEARIVELGAAREKAERERDEMLSAWEDQRAIWVTERSGYLDRLVAAESRVTALEAEIRLFLSGLAPADRGKLCLRKDVDRLTAALAPPPAARSTDPLDVVGRLGSEGYQTIVVPQPAATVEGPGKAEMFDWIAARPITAGRILLDVCAPISSSVNFSDAIRAAMKADSTPNPKTRTTDVSPYDVDTMRRNAPSAQKERG